MSLAVAVDVAASLDLRRVAPGLGGRRGIARLVRRAARAVARETGTTHAELSFAIVGDARMATLHGEYLGKPVSTDVLSFPLYEAGEPPLGDVYIGLEQAARQAAALDVPLDQEIARLAIHGTLHVLGYDHPNGRGRESSRMWKLQERILWQLMEG